MPASPARVAPRLALIGLSLLAGLLACAALLLAAARPAWAAPTATTHNFPGAAPCDTSLQACIDGASDGDTIVIAANTYITSFNLTKPVSLTGVASNTVILQALPDQRVMTVTDNALYLPSVVISGLTFQGGNVSLAGAYPANCGGGIFLGLNNSPLIENVIISRNVAASGGGLCALGGATLRLVNSLVISNSNSITGSGGGGVRVIGEARLTGGLFQGNVCFAAGCNGGGLLAFSTLAITGTQFISNTAQNAGGAVWGLEPIVLAGGLFQHNQCAPTAGCDGGALYAAGSLTATGTQFISNTAHTRGGAARVDGVARLTNVLFQDNACLVNDSDFCLGAGLYTLVNGVTLTDTQFISNTALWRAGGLYADGPAVVSGGLFQGNTCTHSDCNGGGMVAGGTLTLTGTQFIGNSSGGSGGGLQTVQSAAVSNALFQANTCASANCQGAGVFGFAGVTLTDTQFLTNTSAGDGAGAAAVTVTVNGGLFQANTCTGAACDGGALLTVSGLSVKGTQFISNTARQRGGAIIASGGIAALNDALFQYNRCVEAACEGGGLYTFADVTLGDTQFISNTSTGSGGGAYANAEAALSGGLFERNACTEAACRGGGLYIVASSLAVTDTPFLSNTSRANGGGINAQGPVTLTGGVFQGNACTSTGCLGGGLYAGQALKADGTTFTGNGAQADGGGVFADTAATLSGVLFEGNACTQIGCRGGGLFVDHALNATAASFLTNTSRGNGGGVAAFNAATVGQSLFQGNACLEDNCSGGGLYTVLNLNLVDTDLISNTTREDGGGVWSGDDALITGGLFERNTCTQADCQGGGLYAVNDLTMSGTTFLNNSADFSAGGVYANAGAHAALTGGLFQGNTAERGGGMNVNGSVAVTGTTFLNNAAGFDGGGLRTAGPATVTAALFRANTAVQGGGFYHGGGAGQVVNTLFANNTASNGGTQLYVNGTGGLFTVLHTTLGMQSSHNITPALTVLTGSVGVTNSIFVYHDTGIQRIFGTVYQDYNAFLQVGISGTVGVQGGAHSLMGNPFFDHTDGHFRLAPGSPAVNTGVAAGVSVDYFGQPRPLDGAFDMGYHEAAAFLRVFLPLVLR